MNKCRFQKVSLFRMILCQSVCLVLINISTGWCGGQDEFIAIPSIALWTLLLLLPTANLTATAHNANKMV